MQMRNVMYLFLVTIGLLASHQTQAESWNYQSYNQGGPAAPGYITLEEEKGEGRLTFFSGQMDVCYRGELKASVDRTDQTIVITIVPKFADCEQVRFVIKTDGTGGTRQTKKGEDWVPDRVQRLLTIRK